MQVSILISASHHPYAEDRYIEYWINGYHQAISKRLMVSDALRLTGDPNFVWEHPLAATIMTFKDMFPKADVRPNVEVYLSTRDMDEGMHNRLVEISHAINTLEAVQRRENTAIFLPDIMSLTSDYNKLYSDYIGWASKARRMK